jgi:hypothetical protein
MIRNFLISMLTTAALVCVANQVVAQDQPAITIFPGTPYSVSIL